MGKSPEHVHTDGSGGRWQCSGAVLWFLEGCSHCARCLGAHIKYQATARGARERLLPRSRWVQQHMHRRLAHSGGGDVRERSQRATQTCIEALWTCNQCDVQPMDLRPLTMKENFSKERPAGCCVCRFLLWRERTRVTSAPHHRGLSQRTGVTWMLAGP